VPQTREDSGGACFIREGTCPGVAGAGPPFSLQAACRIKIKKFVSLLTIFSVRNDYD